MSRSILIIGASGSGKSTSIRTLPPSETFLFNVCSKELPFRGSQKMYTEISKDNINGNMMSTDDYDKIKKTISHIDKNIDKIKYVIIDDSQYLLVNEFMKKHSTQGKGNDVFQLYNAIGDHFWNLIWDCKFYRNDLSIIFLHHSEVSENGNIKAKSIGKMLDDKVDIPGMFSFVFYATRDGERNVFFTNNDGTHPAKTPDGMFSEIKIDNDILNVVNQIKLYYEGE